MSYSDVVSEFQVKRSAPTIKKYWAQMSPEHQEIIMELCEELLNSESSPFYGKTKTVNHLKKHAVEQITGGASLADIFGRIKAFAERAVAPGRALLHHGKRIMQNVRRAYDDSKEDIAEARKHTRALLTAAQETLISPAASPAATAAASDVIETLAPEGSGKRQYRLKKKGGSMSPQKIGGFAVGGAEGGFKIVSISQPKSNSLNKQG